MISAMLWSISSTPAPCSSRTERTTAANAGTSASGKPGGRLVHQHEPRLGRERAGDAEPPLVAVRERRRGRVGVGGEPEHVEQLVRARCAARRGPAPTPSAATSTFSRTDERPERVAVLERAREPVPAAAVRRPPRHVAALERDRAGVGRSKPLSTFTSVDLPAPFGPIRPTTSPRRSSSVTPRSACDALERPRDGGGPERPSGPPLDSAVLGRRPA